MVRFLKPVIIGTVFFLSFQNCKPDAGLFLIDLNEFEQAEAFYFSDIADSVFFVPLDRRDVLNRIGHIVLSDSFLYVGEVKGAIRSYRRNGNYVCHYGDYGRGPGEYKYSWLFDVNKRGEVYLLQPDKKVISVYYRNGEWKGEIPYSGYLVNDSRFNEIVCFNSSIFLKERFNDRGYLHYDWLILDSAGNKINQKINPDHKRLNFGADRFFKVRDYVCYWDPYRDTVYQIDDRGIYNPRYLWKKGKLRLPRKELKVTVKGERVSVSGSAYFRFMRFMELPDGSIYAAFKYGGNYYHVLYDKVTQKWKYAGDFMDDLTGCPGKRDIFRFMVNSTSGGSFVLEAIAPLALKEWVGSEDFKEMEVKTPHFKQELKKLTDNLEENDNWVIVAYRLKE